MQKLEKIEQIKETIAAQDAVLLYISAPNCSVCDALRPKIDAFFAERYPKVVRIQANIADTPELGAEFGVLSAPAILLFFDGKEFLREGRNVSLQQMAERVDKIYNLYFEG